MSLLTIILKSAPTDWTRDQLRNLNNNELVHICRLLGIATSGAKEKKIQRILNSAAVRTEISNWTVEGRAELVKTHTQAQLKQLAKLAGTMHYGSKIQMITALIIWRDRSRSEGQAYTDEYKAAIKADAGRPKQKQLDGFSDAQGSYTTVYTQWNSKTQRNITKAAQEAQQLELF
jgi:hypothetical protein